MQTSGRVYLQFFVLPAESEPLDPLHIQSLTYRIATETLIAELRCHSRNLQKYKRISTVCVCVRVFVLYILSTKIYILIVK